MKKSTAAFLIFCILASLFSLTSLTTLASTTTIDLDKTIYESPDAWGALKNGNENNTIWSNDGDGRITLKRGTQGANNDLTADCGVVGNRVVKYGNDTLTVSAKITGLTTNWAALYIKSHSATADPFAGNKYFIAIHPNRSVVLYRNSSTFADIAYGTLPAGVDITNENKYSMSAVTSATSVDIIFKVNDSEVISYSDTDSKRITEDGYFGITAYGSDAEMTLGTDKPVAPPPATDPFKDIEKIDVSAMAANSQKWGTNIPSAFKAGNDYLNVSGAPEPAAYYNGAVLDGNFVFKAKAQINGSDWVGIILRAPTQSMQPWHPGNRCYLIALKDNSFSVYKYDGANDIKDELVGSGALTDFADGEYHDFEVVTVNTGNGVRLGLKYDGTVALDTVDTSATAITTEGNFGIFGFNNNSITLYADPSKRETVSSEPVTESSSSAVSTNQNTNNTNNTNTGDSVIFTALLLMMFGAALLCIIMKKRNNLKHSNNR